MRSRVRRWPLPPRSSSPLVRLPGITTAADSLPSMPRDALRQSHVGITLNDQSAKMEQRLGVALGLLEERIREDFGLTPILHKRMLLTEIVQDLNNRLSNGGSGVRFRRAFAGEGTFIKPDGGFWTIREWDEPWRYILVAEAKRQGTNDLRLRAGLSKQSAGNAIERLGKNMRGVDALFLGEEITPFVCFGEGCDFAPSCSIIDRVATLNGFFPLNTVYVDKMRVDRDMLKPVSLYFREEPWTPQEMFDVLFRVASRAIEYYRGRYDLE
jgi:type II restriction enzyme